VTIWDVRLFFCAVAVPFLVAAGRQWLEWQERMQNGGLKRSDSYYMEENRREETGKLHKFLRSPAEEPDEPQEGTVLKNALSGCVVALACLPEAVSLSLIVGVSPLNGVWSGAFMNLCSAVVGGRPGLVSFASAAYAVVLVDITRDPQLGIGVMGVAVLISGWIQAFIGSLRLSRFFSLMPQPVLLGIINGLAIVTACSQIDHFRRGGAGTPFVDDDELMGMLSTALVSFAVAWLWPRLPVVGPLVPSTFMGMLVAVVFSMHVSPFPERSLEQVAGHRLFHGGMETLPPWNFPPLEVDWTNKYVWHKAATAGVRLAFVGLVESLVALMIVDQVTETRGSTTRECYGQSLGNVLCGILGLQGGCAVIGQSLINVSSGGRGRLSGISMSCSLFVAVAWLGPSISKLPAAPFIGLMTLVSLNTFSWGVIGTIRRAGVASSDSDTMVIVSVMLATVFLDLAIAVLVGVIISALMFAWNVSTRVQLEIYVDRVLDTRSFVLHSPLFFGSAEDFLRQILVGEITQKQVVLDFSHSNVLDHVGTQAIAKITQRLQRADKRVELIGLNVDAKEIIGCAMALPGD
jgi:SulP family sulfate permease